MKNTIKAIERVVIATGISSVTTQLVTIREFLALFSGNEFVIAQILFIWLLSGGIGTLLANLVSKKTPQKSSSVSILGGLSLLVSAVPVIQIFLIRGLHQFFFTYGTSAGPYDTILFTFLTTAPYAILIGYVLPYSLFSIRSVSTDYKGARIYIIDNAGDVTGGFLFSFLLVYLISPVSALVLSGLPLAIMAFPLFNRSGRFKAVSALICVIGIFMSGIYMERPSLSPIFGTLAYYKESKYGRITIQQNNDQFTLFRDGNPTYSSLDITSAEEIIHYPLSQLGNPDRILLISIRSGIIDELAKYSPSSIDYVETDPEITSALTRFNMIQGTSNLNIIHTDARHFLKTSSKIYDAIILCLPEPDTFQINRYYTDSFFRLSMEHLSEDGIISFQMTGYDNYLSEQRRLKISTAFNTVSECFNNVVMIPGQKITFICGNRPLRTDIPDLLESRQIRTTYIHHYYSGNVTENRVNYLKSLIDTTAPVNRDIKPILVSFLAAEWFEKHRVSPVIFYTLSVVILLLLLRFYSKEEFLLFTTGFTTMGSEVLVIFMIQIFFGYIYYLIGIVVTVFLAGLLPGAWLAGRFKTNHQTKHILIYSDCIIIFLAFILMIALQFPVMHNSIIFYLIFGFSISLVCGYQFPSVLAVTGDQSSAVTRAFSSDLCGAAFGVLLTSIILLPLAGLFFTIITLISLKMISLIMTILFYQQGKHKP